MIFYKLSFFFFIFFLGFSFSAMGEKKLDLGQLPISQQNILRKIIKPNFTKSDLDKFLKILISEYGYDFAKIEVERTKEDEIYRLTATKSGKILNLSFKGIYSFSEPIIRQEFGISENTQFDKNSLVEGAEKIRQFYVNHGFPKTSVDLEIQKPNGADAFVTIRVHEGMQTKISEIKIISTNSELNNLTQKFLKSKVGKVFTDARLAEIRNESRTFFSKKGYFKAELQELKTNFNEDESVVQIEFKIEHPQKYEIQISGYKKIDRLDIDHALDLNNFFSISSSISSELATKIRSYYLSKGFARVEIASEELDGNKVFEKNIRLSINEGARIKISEFKIIGNYSQTSNSYADFIKTHSSELIQEGYYNRDDMDLGLKNFIIDRQNQGYLKARIVSTRAIYNQEKDKITFLINLEEGPLTILDEIRFEGLVAFESKQLLPLTGLPLSNIKTERALKLNKLEESVTKLKEFYRNQGFLEMTLLNEKQDLVSYSEDNTKANVLYKIYEGPKIVVGSIVIEGNSLTKDKVILKELEFRQGDTLTPQKLEESISRLQKLGHFSSIQIKTLEEKTQISNRTVIIKIIDRDPGLFNFGFGLNNERTLTLRGYTGIAYRNIKGSGRGVSARIDANYNVADIKYLENKAALGYLEPYLFNSRMRGRINLSRSRQVSDFEKQIISEVNQSTWTIEEDITSHILLSYDLYSLATVKEFQRDGIEEIFPTSNQNIATMGPTLDLDFRNHPFNPTKGSFTRFNIEYSTPWLGSNATIEYVKYYASFSHYYPFSRTGWIFANNVRAGYLKNLSSEGAVPYEKKGFSLGGQSTIRGFESPESFPGEFELGTSRYRLTTNSTMYLIKSELRFPIMENIGGAIFYDGGAVLIDNVDISDPYRDTVGVAFRYTTPVGAVSLDWGWKLDQKSDRSERPVAFHFSIGTF